jgi:hypothetical protein
MDLPEVTVEQGKLRGSTATDFAGKKYFKFQGIPFAEPPLGKLRFKVFHSETKIITGTTCILNSCSRLLYQLKNGVELALPPKRGVHPSDVTPSKET